MTPELQLLELLPRAITWAQQQEDFILGHCDARILTPAEQETAGRAGVMWPQAVRILAMREMPLPSDPVLREAAQAHGLDRAGGLTYGHGIFIRQNCLGDAHLIAHELRHVAQVELSGTLFSFVGRYLGELMKYGYEGAPLELDAIRFAEQEFPSDSLPIVS